MRPILAVLVLPLLAACVAPTGCATPALRELSRVEALLARSERALALGYRERQVATTRAQVAFCQDVRGQVRTCVRDRIGTRTEREAIDPVAERRIRDNLRQRAAVLRREASRQVAACGA